MTARRPWTIKYTLFFIYPFACWWYAALMGLNSSWPAQGLSELGHEFGIHVVHKDEWEILFRVYMYEISYGLLLSGPFCFAKDISDEL